RVLFRSDEVSPKMKRAIVAWWLFGLLTSTGMLARVLKIQRVGGRAEAILLFTSGSSGKPKGVALTHRNILGNVSQFAVMLDAKKDEVLLASLPFFHSFGCTMTLWYPLIEGVRAVTYPNPLEAKKIAESVEQH